MEFALNSRLMAEFFGTALMIMLGNGYLDRLRFCRNDPSFDVWKDLR